MPQGLQILQGRFGRVALLDMDQSLVDHAHPHCHVLIKLSGADSAFQVRGQHCPLTDETVVLVNPWEWHRYCCPPPPNRALILALYIEPEWLAGLDRAFGASASKGFFAEPVVQADACVRRLAQDLAISLAANEESRLELLCALMLAIIERFSTYRRGGVQPCLQSPQPSDFRMRKALRHLQDRLGTSFTLDDVARDAGLSRAQLFRFFQSSLQITPKLYFNSLRVEAAIDCLARDDRRLSVIADELGFSLPGHFTRFFKNNIGVLPSEFRRIVRLHGEAGRSPAPRTTVVRAATAPDPAMVRFN